MLDVSRCWRKVAVLGFGRCWRKVAVLGFGLASEKRWLSLASSVLGFVLGFAVLGFGCPWLRSLASLVDRDGLGVEAI